MQRGPAARSKHAATATDYDCWRIRRAPVVTVAAYAQGHQAAGTHGRRGRVGSVCMRARGAGGDRGQALTCGAWFSRVFKNKKRRAPVPTQQGQGAHFFFFPFLLLPVLALPAAAAASPALPSASAFRAA